MQSLTDKLRAIAAARRPAQCPSIYDPDDIVQETWKRVLPKVGQIQSVDGHGGSLEKYLYRTLSNLILEVIRAEARRQCRTPPGSAAVRHASEVSADEESVKSRCAMAEQAEAAADAVSKLPPRDRELFKLRLMNWPFSAIGKSLGLRANTAAKRYERIRAKLRGMVPCLA